MTLLYVLIGIVVLAGLFFVGTYNSLVNLRNRMKEALSDIGVQQKRRWDLIPNLVETVKGYATHEKEVFDRVTQARAQAITASQGGSLKDMQAAENTLSGALKSVFAVAEAYPDLKANQNFLHLQKELVDAEDKIQAARRFFNQTVQQLTTKIEQFPSNIVAGMFGFQKGEFFQVDNAETATPQVKF
jgi:LemA protein